MLKIKIKLEKLRNYTQKLNVTEADLGLLQYPRWNAL